MARKPKAKTATKAKPKAESPKLGESQLSKGELRKLNALRKSIGDELGKEAFEKWLKQPRTTPPEDKDAALIAETLFKLIDEKKLKIPRGGYLVTRGRGRVNVTRPQSE